MIINKTYVPAAGIFCIPLLIYGAILLQIIAIEECNPSLLMEMNLGMNNISRYLNEFKSVDKAAKEKSEKLQFEWPNETPLHSVTSKYNTNVIINDPFALLYNVIELALENGDKITYERAINNYFLLTDLCADHEIVDYNSGSRFAINKQVTDTFEIILTQVVTAKNIPLLSIIIYKTGDFVKEKALRQLQTTAPYDDLIDILVKYAKTALDNNQEFVIYI